MNRRFVILYRSLMIRPQNLWTFYIDAKDLDSLAKKVSDFLNSKDLIFEEIKDISELCRKGNKLFKPINLDLIRKKAGY